MKTEVILVIVVLVAAAFIAGSFLQQQKTNTYASTQAYNTYAQQGIQGDQGNFPATPRPISGGGGCGV